MTVFINYQAKAIKLSTVIYVKQLHRARLRTHMKHGVFSGVGHAIALTKKATARLTPENSRCYCCSNGSWQRLTCTWCLLMRYLHGGILHCVWKQSTCQTVSASAYVHRRNKLTSAFTAKFNVLQHRSQIVTKFDQIIDMKSLTELA